MNSSQIKTLPINIKFENYKPVNIPEIIKFLMSEDKKPRK